MTSSSELRTEGKIIFNFNLFRMNTVLVLTKITDVLTTEFSIYMSSKHSEATAVTILDVYIHHGDRCILDYCT